MKLKVVLDTNVLLVSILPKFRFYPIIEALHNDVFDLCISNEILTEYAELMSKRYDSSFFNDLLSALINLPNVYFYDPTYQWLLLPNDPDDNKFVDCAIAANADFIVTNDKHFNVLKDIDFPKVVTQKVDDFLEILNNLK